MPNHKQTRGSQNAGLTIQMKKFCDEWLIDNNGSRAYKAAYTHVKKDTTARTGASLLLKRPNIRAYIDMKHAELAARYEIVPDRILEEESKLAFSDVGELFGDEGELTPPRDLPDRIRKALSSVKVKITASGDTVYEYKLHDKGQALHRVSKHLGMYEKDNKQQNPSLEEVYASFKLISPELAEAVKKDILEHI